MPPGTRTSLSENPECAKVPLAKMTLDSINSADSTNPTVDPVPYVGVQFVAISESQGIATSVGQQFLAALAGTKSVEGALAAAQALTVRDMTRAGYIK
ncbi:MAG: sorbitol/mannitol transport system substrate-binding protein [Paracoccaceae bacterium]